MKRRLVAVSVVFVVVFSAASLGSSMFQTGEVDADETVTRVHVDADGDAVFTLEVRTRLEDETELEGFERYQNDVENDTEEALSSFRDSITTLVDDASNRTGRSMSATNFSVSTTIEPVPVRRGIVRYSFDWNGFADATDEGVRAGDVLSGYILRDSDALVLRPPDGYTVDSVDPSPDLTEDGVRWNGPRDFDPDQPRVVFVPETDSGENTADGNETGTNGTTDGTTDGVDDGTGDGGTSTLVYAVAVLAVIALGGAAYAIFSRRDAASDATDVTNEDGMGAHSSDPLPGHEEPADPPEPSEPTFGDLPDDERVLRIVESEDGRMKQKHLVERTGWSEAKVSQVTSRLEDDGEITKLRMGRENIIELAKDEQD